MTYEEKYNYLVNFWKMTPTAAIKMLADWADRDALSYWNKVKFNNYRDEIHSLERMWQLPDRLVENEK